MNKLPIFCVLAAMAAFPQAQTPLTITNSAGTATGELRMQERRTNGTNYVGIKAPQSVAANTVWALPIADGTIGQCLQTDGAGQWSWGACGGQWATTGSDIYYTTGNVGIGTTTPATESANAKLAVVGALSQSASTLATSNSNAGFTVRANASSGYQLAIGATSVDGSPYLQGLVFNGGSSASSLILQGYGGNVGIGTASPGGKLDVVGGRSFFAPASEPYAIGAKYVSTGGAVYFGATNGTATPDVQISNAGGGALMTLQTGGNVGVGIGSPAYKLDVAGTIQAIDGGVSMRVSPGSGIGNIGMFSNHPLGVYTDSAERWRWNAAGMFVPAANDTYDIGLTGTRVRGVYGKFGEFYKSGSTASADYVETRKYKFKDATGSTGSWDMQADVTATVSQLFSRDNAGDPFRYSVRQSSGSPVNYEILYASIIPEKRNTGLGHSVTDATFPKLGTSSQPWSEIWGTNGDFAGDLTIDGTTVANVLNYASGTMAGTMKPLFGGTGSIGASGYSYGAAFFTASGFTLTDTTTVGYVWTATSTGGAGSWQAAAASQWATTGSDIYYTTGNVGIGTTTPRTTLSVLQSGAANTTADTLGPALFTGPTAGGYAGMLVVEANDAMAANIGGSIGFYGRNTTASTAGSYFSSIHGRKENGTSGDPAGYLTFKVRTTGNADNEAMRIASTGNVGINNATPTYKLDVNGTMQVTGAATFGAGGDFTGNLSAAAATFTGLTIATGASNGYVWTSDASGVGSWQASASGLPVTDTTGIAKGSSDATKIVRLEVDGFTTATTRVLTPPNANATIAGLEVQQSFTAPQTVAIASVQNQMTLAQTNATGAYDPACLVLASTDTVTGTVYGAGRVCAGYESATFTNEKLAIQTATGSGTYQDVVTFKNQVATFAGDITATVGSFSFSSGTMAGTMKPLFGGTGSIGASGYSYGAGYFTTADIGTVEAATAYKMGGTTVIDSSRNASIVGLTITGKVTGDVMPASTGGYVSGTTSFRWGSIATFNADLDGVLTLSSGTTISGSLLPTTNNLHPLGNTSFRWSNVATVNANISGTITAPSGSAGITSTKTVRDSAGTGTCTLIFSGGILTGGTC